MTKIVDKAFSSCSKITEVILPDSLKEMGSLVFDNCKNLASISGLTEDVQVLGSTFTNIPWVSNMADQSDNGMFIFNGILFKATGSDSLVIPDGVTEIGYQAFYKNTATTVSIPSSVKTIGFQAFALSGVTDLTVPDTVNSIDSMAFYNVPHVTYHGSATGSWGQKSLN